MTEWTPELEKLLEREAESSLEAKKIGCNPGEPVMISVLRISFRAAVERGFGLTGRKSGYDSICEKMGLDRQAKWSDNTRKMIELAKAEGRPDIAKKLGQSLYVTLEANRLYPFSDHEGVMKTVTKRIAAAKRGEIKLGPEA